MFYTYHQNNSGGHMDVDLEAGIGDFVIVEADSVEEANTRAENIGLYWDGVLDGYDCECCGDRWDSKWGSEKGDEVPKIYSTPVSEYKESFGGHAFVHYKTGRIAHYDLKQREVK